jgi:hypothetical protein
MYSEIVQWPPALSLKFYVWMSKQAGKGRLIGAIQNWYDLKTDIMKKWNKKMKNWQVT